MFEKEQNGKIPLGNYEATIFESDEIKCYKSEGSDVFTGIPCLESYEINMGKACFVK